MQYALLCAAGCVGYADRINMSVAVLGMSKELGAPLPLLLQLVLLLALRLMLLNADWTMEQRSSALSVFFWGYVAGQIPAGVAVRLVGARRMLGVCILCWCVLTALTPWAARHSPLALAAVRILLGLAEAPVGTAGVHHVAQWAPPEERSRGIVTIGFGMVRAGAGAVVVVLVLVLVLLVLVLAPLVLPSPPLTATSAAPMLIVLACSSSAPWSPSPPRPPSSSGSAGPPSFTSSRRRGCCSSSRGSATQPTRHPRAAGGRRRASTGRGSRSGSERCRSCGRCCSASRRGQSSAATSCILAARTSTSAGCLRTWSSAGAFRRATPHWRLCHRGSLAAAVLC